MKYFPINLDVSGKKVLVVGGGRIAWRKVKSLTACDARVTVVSPCFCPPLARMKDIKRVVRRYRKSDLRGACLVIGATDSPPVNRRISEHASAANVPVNIVDQTDLCTFIVPSVVSKGDLLIAISTGGGSPTLARRLREQIEKDIDPLIATHLSLLKEFRPVVLATDLGPNARKRLFKQMADDEVRNMLSDGGVPAARRFMQQMLDAAIA